MKHMKSVVIGIILFINAICPLYAGEALSITIIKSRNIDVYNTVINSFKSFFDSKGINVQYEEYSIEKKQFDEIFDIYRNINLKQPDLVLTLGTSATRAVQKSVENIPVLFTMVCDPESSGISRPGVIMGISPEIKLQKIKTIFPDFKRVGLIYTQESVSEYKQILQACNKLGLQLIKKKINTIKEFPRALDDISWRIDYFLMIPCPDVYNDSSVRYMLLESLRTKVPVVGLSSHYSKAGALISFEPDYKNIGVRTAEIALRLFSNEDPSNINFVKPKKIHFSLNLTVADRLGLKIPEKTVNEAIITFGK